MWKPIAIWMALLAMAAGDLAEKPHPRLWLPASSEGWLREKIAGDPLAVRLQASAMTEADRILTQRTCRYEIPDGKRLLRESRLALHNIMHCAWAWRISGEEKYRLRTITELEAACALQDWNSSHFLDVGELATAVAAGYDWLYPTLTADQRGMCEKAIIDKALMPAKAVYDKGGWWSVARNNWSQVCGSGIALAAAAIAGEDRGLSKKLFSRGVDLMEDCAKFYEPDGMYPEGPGYWHYGTNFHVMLLAACGPLEQPFTETPILRKGGAAIMHLTGPTRMPFNFADGHAGIETPSAAQCWIASHYEDEAQALYVRSLFTRALESRNGRVSGERWFPLSILWLPEAPATDIQPPDAAVFHGEQTAAMFRSGWDPDAAWLAIKGGTPAASHGHMDVGSFCYDAHGLRWIHDLGSDNYNLPGYFGGKRFTYYRLQNRAHNTLEIAGKLQDAGSEPCPVTAITTASNPRFPLGATFNLSAAYSGSAKKVLRSARFENHTGVALIEDDITAPKGDVVWRAFTDADCEIKGSEVVLTKEGKQVRLRQVSKGGTWSIAEATPPTEKEDQNEKFRAVVLTVPKAARIRLEVEIRP